MILCLGDLGRSPRMQYHALSCAKAGLQVDLLGYHGSDPMPALTTHPLIHLHRFHVALPYSLASSSSPTSRTSRLSRLVLAPLKVALQVAQLLWHMLFLCPTPTFILVQNPPSIPSLAVCACVALLRSASLLIDWHNFGYSLIALSLGPHHRLTALHRAYEHLFSRAASAHLCVTRAMQGFLLQEWGVRATVLYDRPPREFHPLSVLEMHELWVQLQQERWVDVVAIEHKFWGHPLDDGTLLTRVDPGSGGVVMREDRPVVLVSSTSWTADEDFSLLLDAVKEYEEVREEEVRERARRDKRGDEEKRREEGEVGGGGGPGGAEERRRKRSAMRTSTAAPRCCSTPSTSCAVDAGATTRRCPRCWSSSQARARCWPPSCPSSPPCPCSTCTSSPCSSPSPSTLPSSAAPTSASRSTPPPPVWTCP